MRIPLRLAALFAGTALPFAAVAQKTAPETALKPIVITAGKRTAESKDIPASVAVEQGETFVLQKTDRRDDAIASVPNAITGAVTAKLYTSFTATRGVGSSLIESDPTVGVYLDGVGIGSSQAHSGTLLDVDRIEILRGPQGTLYGRNNLAGKVGVNYRYRSSYYFDVQNTIRQSGYGLLDAYAGLENDRYAAFVFAKNIGDVDYRTVAANLGVGTLVTPGDPLTFGGSFRVKF